MKKNLSLLLFALITCNMYAQLISFEDGIPSEVTAQGNKGIAVSDDYYKEGTKSLKWNFAPHSSLDIQMKEPMPVNKNTMRYYGIYMWFYNEQAQSDSIRFEFYDDKGETTHSFSYRLFSKGWRACWIGFSHMKEEKKADKVCGVRLIAPERKGTVYLDRITLPKKKVNDRTTPDYQMPHNNSLKDRLLWHWCLVWYWEQFPYDIPLPEQLSVDQTAQLRLIESRMDEKFSIKRYGNDKIAKANELFAKAGIARHGKGYVGAPLVTPDELQSRKGEISWAQLETMLSGFAADVLKNNSSEALQKYTLTWEYAIDQGFAWGSGMGTNHHYGYRVGHIYTTAWMMRKYIYRMKNCDEILATLRFWAALQETRQPCDPIRDELLDSWHTLTEPKYISAMMIQDDRWKYREMLGLSRWISTSLNYTPGTIGGIKPDGTTFHHGMFYPGYTTGVLAHLGDYVKLTDETEFEPTLEAKKVLKSAFVSMCNYCNTYEWAIGLSGRHPFGGKMGSADINSFANLALAGDLSDKGDPIDMELAGDYLRLIKKDTPEARQLKGLGAKASPAPQGFFVYNYGAAGIHRRGNWMVTLKGYNTNVPSSEIYVKDNRYGRYQSYGSVQIFGQLSRKASGYDENGWDWNRLPGTTTIHLPYELLENPTPMSMIRSEEEFAGASSLAGKNGIFGIKLMEAARKNYTPDFVARKSVFCFGNRLVCLGSDITNSNAEYPTETTLFQSRFDPQHPLLVNGSEADRLGYVADITAEPARSVLIGDGYDNYYLVREGTLKVQIARQESRHEKNCKPTTGNFSSAWITHGPAPRNAGYEYMVLIQPDQTQLSQVANVTDYTVIRKDQQAHIVRDHPSGIIGYVVFDTLYQDTDPLIFQVDAETLLMVQPNEDRVTISVCDPNLNIEEKGYTVNKPSQPLFKHIVLKGSWRLAEDHEQVKVEEKEGNTLLTVRCQHGIPVELTLMKQ